jgi:hypothetical protein
MEIFLAVLTVAAFVLALVAILRGAPALQYQHSSAPDSFTVWNPGPSECVVVEAFGFVPIAGDEAWKPVREFPPEVMEMDERLWGKDEFCREARLAPQERYEVMVGVNSSLRIKYRVSGMLGFLSRGTLTIHGAM